MRVCLVSAPTVTDFEDPAVAEDEAVRLVSEHAPIGILNLAAVLELQGIVPQIVDLNRLYYEYLRSEEGQPRGIDFCWFVAHKLEKLPFDVFGFSTICSSYPLTLRIAEQTKRLHPGAAIVLGGPQASAVDVPTLKAFPFIDAIVRGEAEEILPCLLEAFSSRGVWAEIPGITFRQGHEVVRNRNAPVISDLDSLPMPAFHLYPHMKDCHYVPLELGRGCPFACEFCSTSNFFGRRFRLKSPQHITAQMCQVKQVYSINTFDLIHDMFPADRKRVVAFCTALLECGQKFCWNCSARTYCLDDELIALMARAGCRAIFFGIETGSERTQREINKNLDLAEAALRIRCADKHRIRTGVSLITGFPKETREDLKETVSFLVDSVRFDRVEPQLHLVAPLADSPLYARCREQLRLDDICSDISYQGWRQDPANRSMIARYPEIFPNFYSVPCPGLDGLCLKELTKFVLHGIGRCRWLLVALHQGSGDLLAVFDAWRTWRAERAGNGFASAAELNRYYAGVAFRQDLLEFVKSRYLPTAGPENLSVATLIEFESACSQAGEESIFACRESAGPSADCLPVLDGNAIFRLAEGVLAVKLGADYKKIIQCLRRKGRLDRVPARPVVVAVRKTTSKEAKVMQLSPLSARLVCLCDGRRTAGQVAEELGTLGEGLEGIPTDKGCLFALETLRRQGLLSFATRDGDPMRAH